jgi:hypothetical protein
MKNTIATTLLDVMLSEAKHLLFRWRVKADSSAAPQNDARYSSDSDLNQFSKELTKEESRNLRILRTTIPGTFLGFAQIVPRNGAPGTGEFLAPRTLRTQSDTPRRVIVSGRERSKKYFSPWSQ